LVMDLRLVNQFHFLSLKRDDLWLKFDWNPSYIGDDFGTAVCSPSTINGSTCVFHVSWLVTHPNCSDWRFTSQQRGMSKLVPVASCAVNT
jgi:hypothetical protein